MVDLNNNISRMMAAPAAPGTAAARVEGLFVRQDKGALPTAPGGSAPGPAAGNPQKP